MCFVCDCCVVVRSFCADPVFAPMFLQTLKGVFWPVWVNRATEIRVRDNRLKQRIGLPPRVHVHCNDHRYPCKLLACGKHLEYLLASADMITRLPKAQQRPMALQAFRVSYVAPTLTLRGFR